MAELPIFRYAGEVCLVSTSHDIERAQADIRQERITGFDTETRPSFRKGETHPPALVQIATSHAVYLFRLQTAESYHLLTELLEQSHIVKAGVAVADDLRALHTLFPIAPQNVIDLGKVARRNGFTQTGLRSLAGILLGIRIPKGSKTSNWAAQRLTAAQITYAATDAWVCRELFVRFQELNCT